MGEAEFPRWVIALIGIFTGFLLKELSDYIKGRINLKKYKRALDDELITISHQLEFKIDIAEQMIQALKIGKFMDGTSVPFARTAYDSFFPFMIDGLCALERDNVRHIYSTLEVSDKFMNDIEKSFKDDSQSGAMSNVNAAYLGKIEDILETYRVVQNVVKMYLIGEPVNIYHREYT